MKVTRSVYGLALFAVCFALMYPGSALGVLLHTFDDPTPTDSDSFGWSVAIEGNQVVIGAPVDDTHGANVGQVHVFDASTGSLVHTLDDPTVTQTNDKFGYSVAIEGGQVLVGAPLDSTTASFNGQAHLFDASTGNLLQAFNDPSPRTNEGFGQSVAIAANRVLVGVPFDDTQGSNIGLAYLFNASTGVAGTPPFAGTTATSQDNFGWSVAIDGDLVLIGAPFNDTFGADVGRAYLFEASTANHLRTFENPSVKLADQFGFAVAIDGNHVLIGAPFDDTLGPNVGQAYLFDATTGSLLHTFDDPTPSLPAGGDEFGRSVAIEGNNVLIGARLDASVPNACCGQAHLFDAITGNLEQTYVSPFPNDPGEHRFGHSVALDGNRVLIGAYANGSAGILVGRAYLFDLNGNSTPSALPALSVPSLWLCIAALFASTLIWLRRANRSPKDTRGN